MKFSEVLAVVALVMTCGHAAAELSVIVATEPTEKKEGLMLSRTALESNLSRASGLTVNVTTSDDMTDVMRATRSGGYDLFIGPAQVAASALARGYELVGSTAPAEQYVLVGREKARAAQSLRGGRVYLPQQDSIYTYMARGMLNANGLSFKDLALVEYARYPQAGLTAVNLRMFDATVILKNDWGPWEKQNPGVAKVLATSSRVPGGLSVVMKKDLPADVRARIAKWFVSSAPTAGFKPISVRASLADYEAVAQLGTFTPKQLPGATVVSAKEVQELMANGAVLIDTRTEKEYKTKRIPNAIWAPYFEKSLKDVAFDPRLDDFTALSRVDPSAKIILACNGAECWKSYKASRYAVDNDYKSVYWFRGGLPEWEATGLAVAKD